MKHRFWIVCFPLAASLAGCLARQEKNGTGRRDSAAVTTAIGADRDAHGCIGSAGYVWSQVREECIRPFEAGIRMAPAAEPGRYDGRVYRFRRRFVACRAFSARRTEDRDTRPPNASGRRIGLERRGRRHEKRAPRERALDYRAARENPLRTVRSPDYRPIRRDRRQEPPPVSRRGQILGRRAEVTLDGTVFDLPQYPTRQRIQGTATT